MNARCVSCLLNATLLQMSADVAAFISSLEFSSLEAKAQILATLSRQKKCNLNWLRHHAQCGSLHVVLPPDESGVYWDDHNFRVIANACME